MAWSLLSVLSVFQFSSTWYLCASKSHMRSTPSLSIILRDRVERIIMLCCCFLPMKLPWNSSNVRLTDDDPLSSFQRFLFPCLSPPGERWCDVLGFVPAGSVSSSSAPQIFQDTSHLWGLLCPPVYLLGRFPSLRHVQDSTPTGVFEGGCRPLTHSSPGLSFHFSLFVASSLNLWGWWHVLSDCHTDSRLQNIQPHVSVSQAICYFCFVFWIVHCPVHNFLLGKSVAFPRKKPAGAESYQPASPSILV